MDLKNTALKFWRTEEEESGYGGPCLVKSEHMDILVRTPRQFSDVREYADALMSGCTLMVSFEAVDCVMRNRTQRRKLYYRCARIQSARRYAFVCSFFRGS